MSHEIFSIISYHVVKLLYMQFLVLSHIMLLNCYYYFLATVADKPMLDALAAQRGTQTFNS